MNYNPYAYYMPLANTPTKAGLFRSLFRGVNLGKILTNTGKTLNVINQTLPIVKQASPIIRNTKTMFKVMNEFKKVDTPVIKEAPIPKKKVVTEIKEDTREIDFSGKPVFFM